MRILLALVSGIFLLGASQAFAVAQDCRPMRFNRVIDGKKIAIFLSVSKNADSYTICDSSRSIPKVVDRKGLSLYVDELKGKIESGTTKAYRYYQQRALSIAIRYLAKTLGIGEQELLKKMSNSEVPESEWATFVELFGMPSHTGFVPAEVYFGKSSFSPIIPPRMLTIPLYADDTVVVHEILHHLKLPH